jgi:hypothetical protein
MKALNYAFDAWAQHSYLQMSTATVDRDEVKKVVVSVNGKTYQYDPSGSCETQTHLGPLQPFPNVVSGYDFKDLAQPEYDAYYDWRAHYISSTDATKQAWIDVGDGWHQGMLPQGEIKQYADPSIVQQFGTSSGTMNFTSFGKADPSSEWRYQLPFTCDDATIRGSVEKIADVGTREDSYDFYITASSLHNGQLYTVSGADAGTIQRTCVQNCAKGETGKVLTYANDSTLISYPQVMGIVQSTGDIYTDAERRGEDSHTIIKTTACDSLPCKPVIFASSSKLNSGANLRAILVDEQSHADKTTADVVYVVEKAAIFKVTEGSVEMLKAFDDAQDREGFSLDSKTGTIYWALDGGTSLVAFDIKTKVVTTICIDCGCQDSHGTPIPPASDSSYHFDDSSGKIVVNHDWGVFFIDPSTGVAKSARCTQGFASTSLVVVGAGYTAMRLSNLVLDPAKKGEMYSIFGLHYNSEYSLIRLSDVEG